MKVIKKTLNKGAERSMTKRLKNSLYTTFPAPNSSHNEQMGVVTVEHLAAEETDVSLRTRAISRENIVRPGTRLK